MSDGHVQSYLLPNNQKLRYIGLSAFLKSLVNFSVFLVVFIAFLSFYTFVFYGGFGHPFFDYGGAQLEAALPILFGAIVAGSLVFAIARSKTYLDQNQLSVAKNSINIVRGLYFKKKLSLPFNGIVNINSYQSVFAKRAGLIKADLLMADGSSVYLGVFDQDKFVKFERKVMRNINQLSAPVSRDERVQGIPATA